MSEHSTELLIDEVRKLRETGEALVERVEDVAASIRYMTNNLLDDEYHPEMAHGVRQLAHQVGALVSLAPGAKSNEALPPFTDAVSELSCHCQLCAQESQQAVATSAGSEAKLLSDQALPPSIESRLALLLAGLAEEAKQLAGCERLGEVTAWQWWENRFASVRAALETIEYLEEAALGQGVVLEPHIERLGGVPPTLQREAWPDDFSDVEEAAGADGNSSETPCLREEGSRQDNEPGKQTELFADESPTGNKQNDDSEDEQPVDAETQESPGRGMDSFAPTPPDLPPYTLDDYRDFVQSTDFSEVTAESWQAEYRRLRQSRETFLAQLVRDNNAQSLKALAMRHGCLHAKSQKKSENAEAVYSSCVRSFVLGNSVQYNPMSERIEDAVDRIVESLTDLDFQKYREERQLKELEHKKAIENPETLAEFYTFVREMGEHNLSDEQHLRRDRLYADMSRQTRREQQSSSVSQFQSASLDGLQFTTKEGYHEKRNCPLWIVQLSTRVDRPTFGELKTKAKQLGGWYSSFKKSDAGFQFLTPEAAEKFVGLREGDADRSDELEDRRIRQLESAGERFAAMADRLTETAETTLAADEGKLKNTARRAAQAASVRARAREDLATATTLQSLAAQLSEGEATYLDGIRYAVQIKTLRSLLRRAHWTHVREVISDQGAALSNYERSVKQQQLERRPLDASDIRYAEYPKPYLYRGHLERAFAQLSSTKGVKQVTAKMQKIVARSPRGQDFVEFNYEQDIALLEDFLGRAKAAGYDCYWFDHCLEDYKRLRAANIHDAHELRAALAELLPHLSIAESDDPVTQAIDELRCKDLPDFFPTPRPIIHQMLDLADIQGDDRVLEPSAGMGDILDAVWQRHPDVELKAIERNHTLADVLAAKGYDELTTFGDFLEHQGPYDKIVMNPPFEQGADVDHVQHAYKLLRVGGRLVSVMCKGPFFRDDAKSREFREWLDGLDHDVVELPEDSFRGVDAFRQTGVRTALVVIEKAN